MTPDVFDEGMNLLEHNFRVEYPADIRMVLWKWIKTTYPEISDEMFNTTIKNLAGCTYPPRIMDIKDEIIELRDRIFVASERNKTALCESCHKSYKRDAESWDGVNVCRDCMAKNNSPESRERLRRWKEASIRAIVEKEKLFKRGNK